MKILVIGTSVYTLPPSGYSGLEQLVYQWSVEFARAGHSVSVVAPEGSQFPPELNIQLIPTALREGEDSTYMKYKDKLSEFDAVFDNSWLWYSVLSQMEADHQLPILHVYHSDAANLGSPPPIKYPCIVGLSNSQSELIAHKWGVMTRTIYNGIDLSFYKADPETTRSDRYLFIGRYTPEKCPLDAIFLAEKCRVPLDMFGDLEIIANADYARKVFEKNDGRQIRVNPGIPREEVVKQMRSHKALIHLVSYNEAFGLVPVESQACGLPVIVNRRGALPELVKNGKSGFVVSTLEECEDLIRTDAVNKLKTEDIIKQGRKFSIEKSAKGHLSLLKDLAEGYYW